MRCSFVHFGDVHLGTQQYDCPERLYDFGRAWLFACDYIANARPDFAICAGDLFNRFTINPVTFEQAYAGFARLREAGVPILDIQGNHDRTKYGEPRSWLHTLAEQGLMTYLDVETSSEGTSLRPVKAGSQVGSFVEWAGCRILGVRYLGASTERVLAEVRQAAQQLGDDGLFTILVLHAGVEGIVPNLNVELTAGAAEGLREWADYVALGHIHKHFAIGNFIYNGGSLETWAQNEWGWSRGLLHVEIDTDLTQPISYRLIDVPRRPFSIMRVDVAPYASPRELLHACFDRIEAERRRLTADRPVAMLNLEGMLRFAPTDLPVNQIEEACRRVLNPVAVRVGERYDVRNFETEGEVGEADEPLDRPALERAILRARLAQDERYAPRAAALAELATELKEQALRKPDSGSLLETLRSGLRRVDDAPRGAVDAIPDIRSLESRDDSGSSQ